MTTPDPTPEARLIDDARRDHAPRLSVRQAASHAGISESRWRQIIKGYTQVTAETAIPTVAPDDTLAAMARAVDVTPTQLRDAGRHGAADVLARLIHGEDRSWDGDLTTVPHAELLAELERRLDAAQHEGRQRDTPPVHLRSVARTVDPDDDSTFTSDD